MGMEIPGILRSAGVPEAMLKEAAQAAAPREPRAAHPAEPGRDELARNVRMLEETFQAFNRRVRLAVNEEIDQIIIKVVDTRTDKVIKEIPAEEIQRMTAKIREMIGVLVDEQI